MSVVVSTVIVSAIMPVFRVSGFAMVMPAVVSMFGGNRWGLLAVIVPRFAVLMSVFCVFAVIVAVVVPTVLVERLARNDRDFGAVRDELHRLLEADVRFNLLQLTVFSHLVEQLLNRNVALARETDDDIIDFIVFSHQTFFVGDR